MKEFDIGTIGDFADDERLQERLARQAKLDLTAVPKPLHKFSKIASKWGISDDALRALQWSKHPIEEIFAAYDEMEKSKAAFETYWKELGARIRNREKLTITERCYFYLSIFHAEVAAEKS